MPPSKPHSPEDLRLQTAVAMDRLADGQEAASKRLENLEKQATAQEIHLKNQGDTLKTLQSDLSGLRDDLRTPISRIATVLEARDKAEGARQAGISALLGDARAQAVILLILSGILSWYFGGTHDYRGITPSSPVPVPAGTSGPSFGAGP